ncbi:hypothetical protein SCRES2_gp45 [Synechococcus phage S-CRES2]|nr:hypothetical protein SCRES2_gp45 [Synechococcus phage S-CRES2]
MLRKPWPIKKGLAAPESLDVTGPSVCEIAVNCWPVCQFFVTNTSVGLGVCKLSLEQSATLLLFLLDVLKDGHWDWLHSASVPVAWLRSVCNVAVLHPTLVYCTVFCSKIYRIVQLDTLATRIIRSTRSVQPNQRSCECWGHWTSSQRESR